MFAELKGVSRDLYIYIYWSWLPLICAKMPKEPHHGGSGRENLCFNISVHFIRDITSILKLVFPIVPVCLLFVCL